MVELANDRSQSELSVNESRRRCEHKRAKVCMITWIAWLLSFAVCVFAGGESEEWIRIIARLRVPEPVTPPQIHAVQESVLRELASAPYRLVRRFDTLPFLVLEVSPSALARLRASSEVTAIEDDSLAAPQPVPLQRPTPPQDTGLPDD